MAYGCPETLTTVIAVTAVLDRILEAKRQEVVALRARRLPSPPRTRSVGLKRNSDEPLRMFAEIKFKSPSAGPLSTALSVGERAAAYERAGASVVSVLCDSNFFGGAYEHLTLARESCSIPLLCKEFVIDEIQLDCARAFGADLVLLIARCLGPEALHRFHRAAIERGLTPLVEIATLEEAAWVRDLDAPSVGVNARDLDTLEMDASRASLILKSLHPSLVRIHLSGLKTPTDIAGIRESGVDGALVGEVLMRESNPEPLLRRLVEAA